MTCGPCPQPQETEEALEELRQKLRDTRAKMDAEAQGLQVRGGHMGAGGSRRGMCAGSKHRGYAPRRRPQHLIPHALQQMRRWCTTVYTFRFRSVSRSPTLSALVHKAGLSHTTGFPTGPSYVLELWSEPLHAPPCKSDARAATRPSALHPTAPDA